MAEIPELPGCHAHGSTQQEALYNVSEDAESIESTVKTPHPEKDFFQADVPAQPAPRQSYS